MRQFTVPAFALAALIINPSAVLAQETSPAPAPARPKIDIEAAIAPEWTTQQPFNFDDHTDATAASITASTTQEIGDGFSARFTLSPSARLDSDDDDKESSSVGFGAELISPDINGLKAFVGIGYKHVWTGFFSEGASDEVNQIGGLRYAYTEGPRDCLDCAKTSASWTFNRTDSTDNASDLESFQVKASLASPAFVSNSVKLVADVVATRKWKEHTDATYGYRERLNEWSISAGLDFSPLIRWLLFAAAKHKGASDDEAKEASKWVRRVIAGYKHSDIDSNIDVNDKTPDSPSVMIAVGREF